MLNSISKIAVCAMLASCCVAEAAPVEFSDGNVNFDNVSAVRSGDRLLVTMDVDVSGYKPKNNKELILKPVLANDGDTLRLREVVVAGRNRYYSDLRNGLNTSAILLNGGGKERLEYSAVLPYEAWMNGAQLNVSGVIAGCCDETVFGDEQNLMMVSFETKRFMPEFLYVTPEAVAKINELEGSAYIDFPVNRTEIHPDYRRNPIELQKIIATIDTVRNDADTRIIGLSIKGYASPEGSYANNERLAKGRTAALKDFVNSRYAFPDSIITTDYEPEDWKGLERYVVSSALANKDAILEIIAGQLLPDEKDAAIKRRFPADYAFLLKEVYPGLRHSDYVVRYQVREFNDIEEIKRLIKTSPSKLSLNEMYLAAKEMEPGSEEFRETFDVAVRMFPQDAVANLNAANIAMMSGDMQRAARYLDKAGDSGEAEYARGTRAAILGDNATAMSHFIKSREMGIDRAAVMIEQIEEINRQK